MLNKLFVGLDVHKETIAVALAEAGRDGDVRSYGTIRNTPEAVAGLLKKIAKPEIDLHCCYEAGPCGYNLHRQLIEAGHSCIVVAPARIPRRPSDRVKTDRRDALMLAKLHRAGELTSVWVPDPCHEAMRDLVRCRASACEQQRASRQRVQSFLLRLDRSYRGIHPWTKAHYRWLCEQTFEIPAHKIVFQSYVNDVIAADERIKYISEQIDALAAQWAMKPVFDALCAMRGVSSVVAATVLAVAGDVRRFETPRQLMAYFGLVPCEHSSGGTVRRGGITKTGDHEVRRVLVQAAWAYRLTPRVSRAKVDAYTTTNDTVRAIAWKAQLRLNGRYRRLTMRGKSAQITIIAVAREVPSRRWLEIGWRSLRVAEPN